MSVAARVSQEMGVKLGNEVSGIQVYSHQLLVRQFGTIMCAYTRTVHVPPPHSSFPPCAECLIIRKYFLHCTYRQRVLL